MTTTQAAKRIKTPEQKARDAEKARERRALRKAQALQTGAVHPEQVEPSQYVEDLNAHPKPKGPAHQPAPAVKATAKKLSKGDEVLWAPVILRVQDGKRSQEQVAGLTFPDREQAVKAATKAMRVAS